VKPPEWLDKVGRAYWRKVAQPLMLEGLLNPVTADLLATAANAYSTYRLADEMLKEEGRVIKSKGGTMTVNPWARVQKQAFDALCRVYKELQLAGPVAPISDELDTFLEKRRDV